MYTGANLPSGATVLADKGYNDDPGEACILFDTGVRLIPIRKKNMKPNDWVGDYDLRKNWLRRGMTKSSLIGM